MSSFGDRLRSHPLVFEPVPPSARLGRERLASQVDAVVQTVLANPRIDAINVPELVDENHEGRPYYRSGDVRGYARRLAEATGRETVVNKVVAHLPDRDALVRWSMESVAAGIAHAILVGGSSRYIPYPGPPVIEADRICAPIFGAARGRIGNIAIPQRTGEAHRMVAKTQAGCAFFTTQIVFDAGPVRTTLTEYASLCAEARIRPVPVLLSLAPLADEADIEFIRWLGADIPERVEREVLAGGTPAEAATRSIELAVELYREVGGGAGGPAVPLGANVEQVSVRHLPHAARMAEEFARILPARA